MTNLAFMVGIGSLMMQQRSGVSATAVSIEATQTTVVQRRGVHYGLTDASLTALASAWGLTADQVARDAEWIWSTGETRTSSALPALRRIPNDVGAIYGPDAIAVYETTGAKTVSVLIYHQGRIATGEATITVTSEDAAYPTTATAVWSPAGDFTDAPTGAVEIGPDTGNLAAQFAAANSHLAAADRRLLLVGGEEYDIPEAESGGDAVWSISMGWGGNTLGVVGTGRAIVKKTAWVGRSDNGTALTDFTSSRNLIVCNPSSSAQTAGRVSDYTIYGIEIDEEYNAATVPVPYLDDVNSTLRGATITAIQVRDGPGRVTIHDCDIRGVKLGVSISVITSDLIISDTFITDWLDYGIFAEGMIRGGLVGCNIAQNIAAIQTGNRGAINQEGVPNGPDHGPIRLQSTAENTCIASTRLLSYNGWTQSPGPGVTTTQPSLRIFQGSTLDQCATISRCEINAAITAAPQNENAPMPRARYLVIERSVFQTVFVLDSFGVAVLRNPVLFIADAPTQTGAIRAVGPNILDSWIDAGDFGPGTRLINPTIYAGGPATRTLELVGSGGIDYPDGLKDSASATVHTGDGTETEFVFTAISTWSGEKPVVYVGDLATATVFTNTNGVAISGSRTTTWTVTFLDAAPASGVDIRIAYTPVRASTGVLYPNPLPDVTYPTPVLVNPAVAFRDGTGWTYRVAQGGATSTPPEPANIGAYGQPLAGSTFLTGGSGGPRFDHLGTQASGHVGAFALGADISGWPGVPRAPAITFDADLTDVAGGDELGVDVQPAVTITDAGAHPTLTTADVWIELLAEGRRVAIWRANATPPSYTFVTGEDVTARAFYGHPAAVEYYGGRAQTADVTATVVSSFTPASLFTGSRTGAWFDESVTANVQTTAGAAVSVGNGFNQILRAAGSGTNFARAANLQTLPNGMILRATGMQFDGSDADRGLEVNSAAGSGDTSAMGPQWTVGLAFKAATLPTSGGAAVLYSVDGNSSNRVMQFRLIESGGTVRVQLLSWNSSGALPTDRRPESAGISADTTYRAIARVTANECAIWLNGVKTADSSTAAGQTDTTRHLIGLFDDGGARFDGLMSSPVVVNNAAISDAEITSLDAYLAALGAL